MDVLVAAPVYVFEAGLDGERTTLEDVGVGGVAGPGVDDVVFV